MGKSRFGDGTGGRLRLLLRAPLGRRSDPIERIALLRTCVGLLLSGCRCCRRQIKPALAATAGQAERGDQRGNGAKA